MASDSAEQRDLRAYVRPVLTRWWLILAVVPLVTIGTYLYYDSKPKVYTASTELFVQPSTLNQILLGNQGNSTSEAAIENLALLIQTRAVANQAAKELAKGKGRAQMEGGSVFAQPLEKSSFISITATAEDPHAAARLANAYATAFVNIQDRQLRGEANRTARAAEEQLDSASTATQREALEEKVQTLQLVASQSGSAGIKRVEPAVAPLAPTDHDPMSNAIFALVVSLMLTVGAAFGLEYLTRRITTIEAVEDLYELPVLTEVPKVDSPAPFDGDGVAMTKMLHEPFHRLQMNLDMLARERPLRTILIASAAPGEGKSIVARNLALAYREAGRNVAVLDADFRKATLGGLMAARQGPGLADILAGRASFGQVVQEVHAPSGLNGNGATSDLATVRSATSVAQGVGELAMVPAGQHHGSLSNALASTEMRQTLRTAADTYGTAIIDSPPLLAVADVLPLLSEADGVLLVTRLGVSTRDSAQRLLAQLKRIPDIHIVGVVANGIPARTYRTRAYGYYYG